MSKQKVLFGAGLYGRIALEKYGKEQVAYFADNNPALVGLTIDEIPIINISQLCSIYQNYDVEITTKYSGEIARQLEEHGICDYSHFSAIDKRYYPTDELIVNPYRDDKAQYLDSTPEGIAQKIRDIDIEVQRLFDKNQLFDHIEIETINKCNGSCMFCPVSKQNDTRVYKVMTWELFTNLIDQLAELSYDGKLALFSNNEPFLDETIIEKHEYARKKLPNARIHMFTNGTLLTIERFVEIAKYLDELIINNYQQQLTLIKPCKEIADYCEQHPEYNKKVTIVLRKPEEILSNRGGDAPNREDQVSYPNAKCVLPFKQMIVRPDGRVSLCCNDPLGKNTLADLTKESIVEAWNNPRFQMVRKCLYEGRHQWIHCKHCDVFNIG